MLPEKKRPQVSKKICPFSLTTCSRSGITEPFPKYKLANEPLKVRRNYLVRILNPDIYLISIPYFGLKMLRWLERRLLWRVRRRLVITYLLVGLTPIVLLTLLGIALAIGGSNRALMRVVTAQMDATAKEALANVRNIAEALGRLPPRAGDESIKSWLDERTASLQPSLPGAYVALWRSGTEKDTVMLGHHEVAKIVSWPEDEKTRGVGSDPTPAGAPLPDWLRGRAEWSGLSE
jgi:hypothetical protein